MVLSVPGTPVVNVVATDTLTHEDVPLPTGSGGVLVVFAVINANRLQPPLGPYHAREFG